MTHRRRIAAAAAGALLALTGAAATTTTAHAAGAPVAATSAAATPAPYTSPGVTRVWVGGDAAPSQCSSGYLCAYVDYNDGWYEFKFYNCGLYHVYYWHDGSVIEANSFVIDDQTGGVTSRFYGKSNQQLATLKPKANAFQYVLEGRGGWDPVYSLRPC